MAQINRGVIFDLSFEEMSRSIADRIRDAVPGLSTVQTMEGLTEGMNNTPAIQVYPQEWSTDPNSNTGMSSFQGQIRQSDVVMHLDVYVRQRSNLGEDNAALIRLADQINPVLEGERNKPYFGQEGLKSYSWRGTRVTFVYGTATYVGIQYVLTFRVF